MEEKTTSQKIVEAIDSFGEEPFTRQQLLQKIPNMAQGSIGNKLYGMVNRGTLNRIDVGVYQFNKTVDELNTENLCTKPPVEQFRSVAEVKAVIDDLNWYFTEYVPSLERDNARLRDQNESFARFLHNFAGEAKRAKEIRMATNQKEYDTEAIIP